MADYIICVATNLFRIYLLSRFVHIFLYEKKKEDSGSRMIHMLAYGGFFIVNTMAYLALHTMWINFACNLIGIALIVLTYTKSIRTILFVTCSVYMIHLGCETIAILPFVNYKDGVGFNQIYEVLDVFLVLVCEMLTEKIINTRKNPGSVCNIFLCLVPLCSIGMLCIIIYTGSSMEMGLIIASIGLILINFFVFYL